MQKKTFYTTYCLHMCIKNRIFAADLQINEHSNSYTMNNTEIERKFLVTSEAFKDQAESAHEIAQGYLCREKGKTIRVRICDKQAFLTIKSSVIRQGIARFEWEREINLSDAQELLSICTPPILLKTRYIIPAEPFKGEKRCWEVDVFHGHKTGLVMAEIELGSEDEPFSKPDWIGEEVTGNPAYYNANM